MPNTMEANSSRITFIGLGNMGAPMAKNLVKKGFNVTVYDLSQSAIQSLVSLGATSANSLKQAVQNADVIISMLPAGEQVKSIYLGSSEATRLTTSGLLSQLNTGTLVIDSSTIAVSDAKLVARAASTLGIDFLDAPVSGSSAGAHSGILTFIVGGEKPALERAEPILEAMGNNIFYAGATGSGQVAKICNNMLLGITMSATAEALNLGVKNGLDASVLSEIMLQSSGRNWALEVYNPYPNVIDNVPSSHGYTEGFMSAHMHKDLHLALRVANDVDAYTPMANQATALYDEHIKQYNYMDFSSIIAQFDSRLLD